MLSSFSMPSDGSAPDRVAAILMIHGTGMNPTWSDLGGDRTIVTLTHDDARLDAITTMITRAHPKVRYVSSRNA